MGYSIHNLATGKRTGVLDDTTALTPDAVSTQPRSPALPPRTVQTQFSLNLGDWLLRHRVSLVCSTHVSGGLIFLGARADGSVVPSGALFPGPRVNAIAAFNQRIYVGTSTQIWRLENILAPDEIEGGQHDRLYVPRNAQITGEIFLHELGIEASGRMIFVSVRYSCLATISPTHAFKPLWMPPFISRIAAEDRCHLNGMAMENGKVRYVSACGTTDSIDGWLAQQADGGVVIDVENGEIILDGLSMPHSPRVMGDALYLLESGRGALVRVERGTGRREDVTYCPGFARGMSIVGHYAVVAISLPRSAAGRKGMPGRGTDSLPFIASMAPRKITLWCGLLVIDLRNGDIAHWARFDGDVSELADLGVIPDVRCPRALGPGAGEMEEVVRGEEL